MQWEEKQQQDGRRTTFLDALRAYALFDIENGSESTGKWHLDMDNGDQKEDEEEKRKMKTSSIVLPGCNPQERQKRESGNDKKADDVDDNVVE
jgi:hypothetical protein